MKFNKTLESGSLWYKYKTAVWPQKSAQSIVVHNAMRILRSIRCSGRMAYISVPITSGLKFYELKLADPGRHDKEIIGEVIPYNYSLGSGMVDEIYRRRQIPVLYPAELFPIDQKWSQDHFQALWLNLIAEKCSELHMSKGWQFSNGGVEEFIHVWQLKLGLPKHENLVFYNTKENEASERRRMKSIPVFDHDGKKISIVRGQKMIEDAVSWIKEKGFSPERLERGLETLIWTEWMIKEGFYQ